VNDRHPAALAARAGSLTGLVVVPSATAAGSPDRDHWLLLRSAEVLAEEVGVQDSDGSV